MPKRKYAIKKLNMQSEVGEEQKYPPTTPTVEVKHKERAFLVLFLLKKKETQQNYIICEKRRRQPDLPDNKQTETSADML